MNKYESLKTIIEKSHSIVVFTGAGISVPSGIPDFRSADGIYNQKYKVQYPPEEIISHSFYEAHPDLFYEFYKEKMCYPNAKPNAAHKYFADLEKKGKNVTVVTQNIDNLHQEAGSTRVYELHGSIYRNYCVRCNHFNENNWQCSIDLNYIWYVDGIKDNNSYAIDLSHLSKIISILEKNNWV